jgi:hypothetical protein
VLAGLATGSAERHSCLLLQMLNGGDWRLKSSTVVTYCPPSCISTLTSTGRPEEERSLLWCGGCHDTRAAEMELWTAWGRRQRRHAGRQTEFGPAVCASPWQRRRLKGFTAGVGKVGRWLVCGLLCESKWGWVAGGPKRLDAHARRGSAGLPVRLGREFQGREGCGLIGKGAGRNAAEIIRRPCTTLWSSEWSRIRQLSR